MLLPSQQENNVSIMSRLRALTRPAPLDPDMAQALQDSVHSELDTPFEFKDTSVAMHRHVLEQKLALDGPRARPAPAAADRELRAELEIWVLQNIEALDAAGVHSHESVLTRRTNGDYLSTTIRGAWMGFKHGRLG
jgi:hypothetical protein